MCPRWAESQPRPVGQSAAPVPLLPVVRPVAANNGFGARYHMIYAPAAYVVTFARLYSSVHVTIHHLFRATFYYDRDKKFLIFVLHLA
jgi:hypothetical protein